VTEQQEPPRAARKLDYASRDPLPPDPTQQFLIRGLGVVVTIIGLVTWFSAYAGLDDHEQARLGIIITGFGITWEILGRILRELQERR
jgi:hypothetical protein